MNTQQTEALVSDARRVPLDVYRILWNDPQVAGVAVWADRDGTTYVQGHVSNGVQSLPGQILTYLSRSELPMPCGCWTLYTREGIQIVH